MEQGALKPEAAKPRARQSLRQPRIWLGAALALVMLATSAVVSLPASAVVNSVVYYSGFGIAGIDIAAPIASSEFVHSRTSAKWDTWTSGQRCNTSEADDFASGPNTLVGWSIGRLGPIYFLAEAPERHQEIDTIWLLDPGDLGRMTSNGTNCDDDLAKTPSQYLAEWLEGDSSRRLMVLSGDLSESDNRAGLDALYFGDLTSDRALAQTYLCKINKGQVSSHNNSLVSFFMPYTTGAATCPPQTQRVAIAGQDLSQPPTIAELIGQSTYRGASGRSGAVVRLYASVFARLPENGGFAFWLNDGRSTWQMASFFVVSPEYQATYGNLSDAEFIVALYNNVLGRGPDQSGQQYWLGRLAGDLNRADVVVFFSDSAEFRILTGTS